MLSFPEEIVLLLLDETRGEFVPLPESVFAIVMSGAALMDLALHNRIDTDLEKLLKDRKISTVIVVGTLAEGAVLYTSSHAAFLGLKVIVPVDGMSSDPFGELATTWILANAPSVGDATTLTSFDMIEW